MVVHYEKGGHNGAPEFVAGIPDDWSEENVIDLILRPLEDANAQFGAIKMHPGVKDELACRGFVCRTLHRLGLNVETIKPNGRPAVGIGWVPPEHAD